MTVGVQRPEGKPARVLVVDDQPLYREGLCAIMRRWPEFQIVGEAANGKEALDFCMAGGCDLVVLDRMMPVLDGLEAARGILREQPGMKVVIMAVLADEADMLAAFDAGVKGYLLKETSSRQLRDHLGDVVRGEVAVSGALAQRIVEHVSSLPAAMRAKSDESAEIVLAPDEVEVMRLVALGFSNEEIGARLYISHGSVKKRLRSIMEKLSLDNRVQVAVYAVRHGMVTSGDEAR